MNYLYFDTIYIKKHLFAITSENIEFCGPDSLLENQGKPSDYCGTKTLTVEGPQNILLSRGLSQ